MNFEKCLCFYGENMPNSARYYTKYKSKLSDDVSLIKKIIILKKTNVGSNIKLRNVLYDLISAHLSQWL